MDLLPQFIEKVEQVFGDAGRAWLPELPQILDRCREKWGLREGTLSPHLRMNYIEFTTTPKGQAVALKIGAPHPELFTEMEALRLYGGNRAARFLDADRDLGAILMQRLQPGTMLWELKDNRKESQIAASTMRDLPVSPPHEHGLPTFSRLLESAIRNSQSRRVRERSLPCGLIKAATDALEASRRNSPDTVLHGDLHHENILWDAERGWTAIDPKGVIGPACLEVGRFLTDRIPHDLPSERREAILLERVEILSRELGYSHRKVARGGLIDCILCLCWGLENSGELSSNWHHDVELARMLMRMI